MFYVVSDFGSPLSEVGSNKYLLEQFFGLILLEYIETWVLLLK